MVFLIRRKKRLTINVIFYIIISGKKRAVKTAFNKKEKWLSGRRRTIGNRVYVISVPWVQIPFSPPTKRTGFLPVFFCLFFFFLTIHWIHIIRRLRFADDEGRDRRCTMMHLPFKVFFLERYGIALFFLSICSYNW